MSTETIIRPVTADDIAGFHRALDAVSRERKFLNMFEAPPLERFCDFVLGVMKDGGPQFVAIAGGEVVGWCDIRRHGLASNAHRGTLGMGIIAGHRGRGLGRRLIEAAMAQARERGFVRIELGVRADNRPAIALYEKVGFAREGVARHAVFVDGQYFDTINMAVVYR